MEILQIFNLISISTIQLKKGKTELRFENSRSPPRLESWKFLLRTSKCLWRNIKSQFIMNLALSLYRTDCK